MSTAPQSSLDVLQGLAQPQQAPQNGPQQPTAQPQSSLEVLQGLSAPQEDTDTGTEGLAGVAVGAGKSLAQNASIPYKMAMMGDPETMTPESLQATQAERTQRGEAFDTAVTPRGTAENTGAVLETIGEFLIGDWVTKGLTKSAAMLKAAKPMEIFEKFPSLQKAFAAGMDLVNNNPKTVGVLTDAARLAGLQTGQSLMHGEDTGEALKSGGIMGGLSVATGTAGYGLKKLFKSAEDAAGSIKDLTDLADAVPSKTEIADGVKSALDKAEDAMHTDFEAVENKAKDLLAGRTENIAGSPLAQAAQKALDEGKNLPPEIRASMKGIVPGTERMEPLLKQLTDPKSAQAMTADSLLDMRKELSRSLRKLPQGDPNKGTIGTLLEGIDNTIEKMTDGLGDAGKQIGEELSTARTNYRELYRSFNTPGVKKLQSGALNDVTQFLTSGNSHQTLDAYRRVTGSYNTFLTGENIFSDMIKDSMENGELNAGKLAQRWKKVPQAVKDLFFGGAQRYRLSPSAMRARQAAALETGVPLRPLLSNGRGMNWLTDSAANRDKIALVIRLTGVGIGLEGYREGNPIYELLGAATFLGGPKYGQSMLDGMLSHTKTLEYMGKAGRVAQTAPVKLAGTAVKKTAVEMMK